MEERTERHTRQPLIHGRMIYRCEQCGKSWPMYLEKGVEEFGANHKPSPFTITCPYCGGLAMDVSGIQKVPGGGCVTLPDGYGYFANLEDRDCGVPILREVGVVRSGAKILVAAEDEEVLEDIQERVKKYINDIVPAELAELAEEEARELMEAARIFAEQTAYSLEAVMGAMMNALNGPVNPKRARRGWDFTTAWDRKEAREKRQTVERATAARFRQYRARESTWAAQKRTGQRRREWRGPWRGEKLTDMEAGAMRRKDVKRVIAYYFGIPAMRAELAVERDELEDEYDGLRGTAYDGAPHSSTPGKPTEELAAQVDARNVWNRLEEIAVRDHVLIVDRENIRGCLDVLKGEYKKLIFAKYRDKYSWARIAASNGVPDRTARWQHDKALDRLGEALEEVPMADELLGRASRARD